MAKIMLKVGGKGDPKVPIKTDFDIRDVLTGLIGSKNVLSPDDKAAMYGNLVSSIGRNKADKLMTHAYIFNQRPDIQNLSMDDRLRRFYDIGASDPEVGDIIAKSKSLGYGVLPGAQTSPNVLNQRLTGRLPSDTIGAVNPEVQRRIMLQVKK